MKTVRNHEGEISLLPLLPAPPYLQKKEKNSYKSSLGEGVWGRGGE